MSNVMEFPVWRTELYRNKLKQAFRDGTTAYYLGKSAHDNPYHNSTDFHSEWEAGWKYVCASEFGNEKQ